MEIEEFPSHIIEKIKNIWETWNSPPRLSSDSLHLDEIEGMNLNNMQEDKNVLQRGRFHQTNDDASNDRSYHDTSE
ncbi:hypothetical protein Godav_012742 [Gossypium davidsonii]|uniref:Uncharacterized protein n=1 Tax=Gossypium davidsonii TaxID=34287 RepID=A0A7J8REY4_GOSDV|nr:hypothetical protein [Gossypium davidsonii]